jgi:hypothetical protein
VKELRQYIQDIKEGLVRGDYNVFEVTGNVILSISVADFQFGDIHLRAYVECDREYEDNLFYKQLYRENKEYEKAHNIVVESIEAMREVDSYHAHEWQVSDKDIGKAVEGLQKVSDKIDVDRTLIFDDHVQLRDDVTMAEAMMTNKRKEEDKMTRSEVENFLDEN